MEMEPSQPVMSKKLLSIVRVVLYMFKKGLSKSKLKLDLRMVMMLRRGKLAGKAIGNLMLHPNHSSFGCRSNDVVMSFVSPRDYEFSCSNSPAAAIHYDPLHNAKRRHNHSRQGRCHQFPDHDDIRDHVQRMFDLFNGQETAAAEVAGSPLALPGFGKTPLTVRQLRVTDSPFPLKDNEEDSAAAQINKAADEFIKKFYHELKQQRIATSLDSPSPYHISWAR